MPQGGGERAFRNGDAGEGALPRRNDAAPYSPPAPRERDPEFKIPEQRGPVIPERKVEIWHVEPDKGPIQVERLPDRPSDIGEPKGKDWKNIIVVHPSDPNDSKFKKEFGKCAGCDGTKGCCPTEGIIFKGPVMTRTI